MGQPYNPFGSQPAGNDAISPNVANNTQLKSAVAVFVTSAAAANRSVHFQIIDNLGRTMYLSAAVVLQIASKTRTYCACVGGQYSGAAYVGTAEPAITFPLPDDLTIPVGGAYGFVVENIDAADQFTAFNSVTEEAV